MYRKWFFLVVVFWFLGLKKDLILSLDCSLNHRPNSYCSAKPEIVPWVRGFLRWQQVTQLEENGKIKIGKIQLCGAKKAGKIRPLAFQRQWKHLTIESTKKELKSQWFNLSLTPSAKYWILHIEISGLILWLHTVAVFLHNHTYCHDQFYSVHGFFQLYTGDFNQKCPGTFPAHPTISNFACATSSYDHIPGMAAFCDHRKLKSSELLSRRTRACPGI